jgi:hypothetical protein
LKKAYESVRRELLYNILIEFGVPMEQVRLIKMCLNDTYSEVRMGKHLSDSFPIQNCLKHGDALSPLLFNFVFRICHGGGPGKPGGTEIKIDKSAAVLC